ncbi:hypothetical protein PP178_12895 [Zeaxanthinibacter sp. PT1]|uniref:hypothetical protein n=1 Tax=Zeaxanthinibacter TaxID=561554 RepID=UPI00234A77E0|nr:hypothetical protein [Zeaxanthinibacter sp. PT1]MDC6352450.1 hypothetical protein [Zeaxanthinibacter sp. PT1]
MKSLQFFTAVLFLFFLSHQCLSAQTYKDDDDEETDDLELQQTSPEVLGLLGINTETNPRNEQLQGNSVFLRQVGEFNQAAILTNTEASEIKVQQNGDFNRTGLFYNTKTAFADLQQNGDANTIRDFVIDPTADISLDLIQQGDGLYFERFGSNSLTESLQFRQTPASPVVIIRSFQ